MIKTTMMVCVFRQSVWLGGKKASLRYWGWVWVSALLKEKMQHGGARGPGFGLLGVAKAGKLGIIELILANRTLINKIPMEASWN